MYSRAKRVSCFGIGDSSHLLMYIRTLRGVAELRSCAATPYVPTEKPKVFPRFVRISQSEMRRSCGIAKAIPQKGDSEVYSFKVKLHLEKDGDFVMGEGRAELLRQIEKYKSLKNAANALGMSYRYAWDILKKTGEGAKVKIVSAKHGGKYGGRTELTEDGMKILGIYEERARLLEQYANFPSPILTVDGIIIQRNKILFIKRKREPFKNYYALPGGFVEYNEKVEDAAVREIREETGLETRISSLFGIYSEKGRDPRCHTVTVVYELDVLGGEMICSKEEVENIKLFSLADIPKLAFDHNKIVEDFKKSKKI